MEETTTNTEENQPPTSENQVCGDVPKDKSGTSETVTSESVTENKNESGVVLDSDECNVTVEKELEAGVCEGGDDARSLGELDSLVVGEELCLGAAGSDSGVEGCGRALSSGGGSRSCASSVVSCGSGCGSESSSLAGAPPRPRRRVNVTVTEQKRSSPIGSSTPRPITAPRGPNLATRERARSREKPTPPEKPRPLTPKPRIRPTGELPNLVRESPALRAKPTKTSAARCRTPNSPSEEKRWPAGGPRLSTAADPSATRVAADKYGTLPRKRREGDSEGSPKHESSSPTSRRATVTRSLSSRTAVKTRVRIYAEKTSQTVLVGSDIESAFNGVVPNIEKFTERTRCDRGVQASGREAAATRAAAAEAEAAAERTRREHAEAQLAAERSARLAAIAELERNTQRLLELAGAGASGGTGGADGCLRALEEQLRAASELAERQRAEIDALRDQCNRLHVEASSNREAARLLEQRLLEAERESSEMQEFLSAECSALAESLREGEAELERVRVARDRGLVECRQLVRMCEQRRQEALSAGAAARAGPPAARRALHALAARLRAATRALSAPPPPHSQSDSGDALTPDDEPKGGLLAAVVRALRIRPSLLPLNGPTANGQANGQQANGHDDDRSRASDDNDNSADLLDSETEPCLVTDPECLEEWWSGAETGEVGAWSGEELSPERESCAEDSTSERDSLRNLSAAIAHRHRSEAEAENTERTTLLDRVMIVDNCLTELLRAFKSAVSNVGEEGDALKLSASIKDKLDLCDKDEKSAETRAAIDTYRLPVDIQRKLNHYGDDDDLELIEKEVAECNESELLSRYAAVDAAASALAPHAACPRLARIHRALETLAFALAAAPRETRSTPGAQGANVTTLCA